MLERKSRKKVLYLLLFFELILTTTVYSEEKKTEKQVELKEPLQKKLIDSENFIKEKKPKKIEIIKEKEKPKKLTEKEKREMNSEWVYREAIRLYKLQSLYSAVDMFVKILRDPTSPYYVDSLFMLGKVYIEIGKKTGVKKYIWTAISYLNIYYSKAETIDWEFFYTKGYAYEILGFYDKALALYKLSLNHIKTLPEQVKTTLGILRASVGLKKMDLLTEYLVKVNIEYLKNHDKKELNFIKGMMSFSMGDYKKALKRFIKTYKEFEEYLIENPNFYYIVAETAYRTKQYDFALQLFKRIIALTQDKSVQRKSILRMADIEKRKGERIVALNYYYYVVSHFKDTNEGKIATLKLMAMMEKDINIRARLLLKGSEEFKDPIKYVITTLALNRTNYVGRFALGNFGDLVMNTDSDYLYKKLEWELSLIYPPKLHYEHKEYMADLWKDDIKNLPPKRACQVYNANPPVMKVLFDRDTLLKISDDLKNCSEFDKQIDLLNFVLKQWNSDNDKLKVAKEFFDIGKYEKSLKILKTIKKKNCYVYQLIAENYIMLEKRTNKIIPRIAQSCPKNDLKTQVLISFDYLYRNKPYLPLKVFNKNSEKIIKVFKKDKIIKKFVYKLTYTLLDKEKYNSIGKIIPELENKLQNLDKNDFCYLNSLYLISLIRTNSLDKSRPIYEKIKDCNDKWGKIAKNIYESSILFSEVQR